MANYLTLAGQGEEKSLDLVLPDFQRGATEPNRADHPFRSVNTSGSKSFLHQDPLFQYDNLSGSPEHLGPEMMSLKTMALLPV